MPANLTPQYKEAEARFRAAKEHDEKVEALEEMLKLVPKHKGTEKIQADIKRRLAKLRVESQKKGKGGIRHADPFAVRREGAGQLVLLGPPNSGKSSIVDRLTRASPEIALYPFTTHKPLPAMMKFENVPIQLVDAPPMTTEHFEHGMLTLLRNASVVVVLADLGAVDPVGPIQDILTQLEKHQLSLSPPAHPSDPGAKTALWIANKADHANAEENLEILREFLPRPWLCVSTATGTRMDELAERAFEALDVIRVYTKPPGKKPDLEDPHILKRGATVLDAATAVHRELAEKLRFVRLWRQSAGDAKAPPSGIKVDRDFVLFDEDVIELNVERSV
jgi:ribosome-interacting GTPase 1